MNNAPKPSPIEQVYQAARQRLEAEFPDKEIQDYIVASFVMDYLPEHGITGMVHRLPADRIHDTFDRGLRERGHIAAKDIPATFEAQVHYIFSQPLPDDMKDFYIKQIDRDPDEATPEEEVSEDGEPQP